MYFNFEMRLQKFPDVDITAGNLFETRTGRRTFRCDHYYDDGSCYGGSDGGSCRKRKKRGEDERVLDRRQSQEDNVFSSREKRQTDDVVGCQKESTNGVDYRGRAAETVEGVACLKWTEGHGGDWADVGEHNFCRNQNNYSNGVWCTVSTDAASSSIGTCNVPKCDPVIATREANCVDWDGGRAYWKWDFEVPANCTRESKPIIQNIQQQHV